MQQLPGSHINGLAAFRALLLSSRRGYQLGFTARTVAFPLNTPPPERVVFIIMLKFDLSVL